MDLSMKERLMIANQLKILEKLYPEEAEDYAQHRKAIENGYKLHYDWLFEWFSEEMSVEECQEVLDILTMYRVITFSYAELEDKSGIDEKDTRFEGFDGNHEGRQFSYVRYFIIDLGRFEELTNGAEYPDFNSHRQMLPKYQSMLKIWKPMEDKNKLTKDEIKKLLEA